MMRVARLNGPVRSALLGGDARAVRGTRVVMTATASLAAVGALAGCAGGSESTAASAPDATGATASPPSVASSADSAGSADYTDGTYTAEGSYVAPSGEQSVEVTLTIQSSAVTAVEVIPQAEDPQSEGYQEKFASGIDDVVVGVPLDELDVDKVAGSSLTAGGFNAALDQIKADAAA